MPDTERAREVLARNTQFDHAAAIACAEVFTELARSAGLEIQLRPERDGQIADLFARHRIQALSKAAAVARGHGKASADDVWSSGWDAAAETIEVAIESLKTNPQGGDGQGEGG